MSRTGTQRMWAVAIALAVSLGWSVGDAAADEEAVVSALASYPEGKQELGMQLGLATGGRVTPGGAYVAGRYSYRLADRDWFELGVGFTFGSNNAACSRDDDDNMSCDHGTIGGFGGEVAAGFRRYFLGRQQFTPYLRAGLAARVISYGEDGVRGFAVPVWGGGGVRARVSPGVYVGADAVLHLGAGVFNKELGSEPQASLTVMGSVEFLIGK